MSSKTQLGFKLIEIKYQIIDAYNEIVNQEYMNGGFRAVKGKYLLDLEAIRAVLDKKNDDEFSYFKLKTMLSKFDEILEMC